MEKKGSERRRHKRIEKYVPATFRIISDSSGSNSQYKIPDRIDAISENISEGGMQLLIEGYQLTMEQIVGIEFNLKEAEEKIKTFAEVKWSDYDESKRKYRTGFEFIAIKDDDKDIIRQLSKSTGN